MTTVAEYKARQEQRKTARYRVISFNPEIDNRKSSIYRARWVENVSDGLRLVGKAHEVARANDQPRLIEHTGWFTNQYEDETVCGVVIQLPSRDGKPLYTIGVSDPNNDDCALVDFHTTTDDILDACRWSDSMAERSAEEDREDNLKQAAEDRIEECKEEIEALYVAFKALATELRANCDKLTGMPLLKATLHREYRRTRGQVRKLRAEIKKLTNEPWEIAPRW